MLTQNQVQEFQQFRTSIEALYPILNSASLDRQEWTKKMRSLQTVFQTEIQPIRSDDYQTHSVLVEINKQMQLLKMDGLFLQTARQSETIQSRVEQIRDRLKLLTNYCRMILESD
ncbi:MAG TPA: heterocyst frequency control protein PatD [Leptolyngbya sp.]|jgi:hypothetical protein|nr:heterocyst frequency control protein PatD [Leptolyngbya sp.]